MPFSLPTLIVVMLAIALPIPAYFGWQYFREWFQRRELERLTREQPIINGWQSYPPLGHDSEQGKPNEE